MKRKTDKEIIRELRAENRQLREELDNLQKEFNNQNDDEKEDIFDKSQEELNKLIEDLREKTRKCNEAIAETKVLKNELIKAADENGVKVPFKYRLKQLF